MATFQVLDYCLFVSVLLISALVGIYYIVKEKWAPKVATSDDILMGGREMAVFPVAMSLIASYMSAITVLGIPTEMYAFGSQYWLVCLSGLLTYPVTCHVFLPFFHGMQLNSAYQYLELRFNRTTRFLASGIFSIEMVLYMAVVLYAPSLALNQVTGLSLWGSILSVGVVVTFYTSMGGLRAVLWTDTFQTSVVISGLIAIIAIGSQHLGGITKVWKIAQAGGRINFWDPSPFIRCTFWGLTIGSFIGQLTIYGANQTMLQRYMSIKDVKKSQLALYVSLPVTMLLVALVCVAGLVIYATFHDCDPLLNGKLISRDQLLPYYVMEALGYIPGVPGLFVACIFSAALSSVSSCLNALSITILEDFIKPILESRGRHIQPSSEAQLAKTLGILGGVAVIAFAFLASILGTTVLQIMISVLGMAGGPLLGVFLMGMFLPCINAKGAVSGLVVSTLTIFWIVIGTYIYQVPLPTLPFDTSGCSDANHVTSGFNVFAEHSVDVSYPHLNDVKHAPEFIDDEWSGFMRIYKLSFLWYPTFAIGVCLIVGILVSWMTGWTDNKPLDPRYIYPVSRTLLCWLPDSIERLCNCNTWWSYNVKKVDTLLSDDDDTDTEVMECTPLRKKKNPRKAEFTKPKSSSLLLDIPPPPRNLNSPPPFRNDDSFEADITDDFEN